MEVNCVLFKVRCSVEFISVCTEEWWLFLVLVALRCRIKVKITPPFSQLDSAIFTIRLTSLNYCKLSVNCLPSGIRDTRRTLVCSWCVSGMLLRSATACVGGSSGALAPSICATRLLPFNVWLQVKVTGLVVPSTAFTVNVTTIENVRAQRKTTKQIHAIYGESQCVCIWMMLMIPLWQRWLAFHHVMHPPPALCMAHLAWSAETHLFQDRRIRNII